MQDLGSILEVLRCPLSGAPLQPADDGLLSPLGDRYPIRASGIPCFAEERPAARPFPGTPALEPGRFEVLLELNAGPGRAIRSPALTWTRAIALDPSPEALEEGLADRPTQAFFVQGDPLDLPIRSGSCDAVVILAGLDELEFPELLMVEATRVLRPRGRLLVRTGRPRGPVEQELIRSGLRLVSWRSERLLATTALATAEL